MGLCLIAGSAHAGEIPAWDASNFEGDNLADREGWSGGYDEDRWGAYDGYAYPYTDDGADSSALYGTGTALDNWLVRGDNVNDGVTSIGIYNYDDDTAGMVFKQSSPKNFYMLVHYADNSPYPLQNANEPTIALVRVYNGQGSVLASVSSDRFGFNDSVIEFRAEYNDGDIRVLWEGSEVILVSDPEPLPAGISGFYAYNNGYYDNERRSVLFDSIDVSFWDEDDDGVADDIDNCEEDANADQADSDGNGIGDACDATDPGPGPGDDEGTDDVGDDDVLPGNPDEDITGSRACGCSAGAGVTGFWAFLLPGLLAWRSRRQS